MSSFELELIEKGILRVREEKSQSHKFCLLYGNVLILKPTEVCTLDEYLSIVNDPKYRVYKDHQEQATDGQEQPPKTSVVMVKDKAAFEQHFMVVTIKLAVS